MRKLNLKFTFYLIAAIILTLGLSVSWQALVAAWQSPTNSTPAGNVDAPINVSTADQAKLGGLTLGGAFKADSSDNTLVVDAASNSVGIGVTNPNAKLEVSSVIKSTPTDAPGACDINTRGGMYYDDSMNEPCFCNGTEWRQFDGDGVCN